MHRYGIVLGLLIVGFYVGVKKPMLLSSIPLIGGTLSP